MREIKILSPRRCESDMKNASDDSKSLNENINIKAIIEQKIIMQNSVKPIYPDIKNIRKPVMKSPQLAKVDSEVAIKNKLFCGVVRKLSRLPLSISSGNN